MSEQNNCKDCKWIEIFMNIYGDKIDHVLCHLTPESKRINMERDCKNCKDFVKKEADE